MNKIVRLLKYDWPLHFVLSFTNWMPDNVACIRLRGFFVSFFVKSAGKNLKIGRDVTIYNPSKISFGHNVYVAKGCFFSCSGGVEIANNILFGPYVVVVTSDHSIKNNAYAWGEPINVGKVIIKDGSWIAAHVTVLSNTTIEEGVLVAANAVIRGNTEKLSIYGGIPAKLIKKNVEN